MQQINEKKEVNADDKNKLITVFKYCLNALRDNEGLTGEKALRNLSYLLTLKLMEKNFNGEINIDDYPYVFNVLDEYVEGHRTKLLKMARFSNLAKENEDNVPVNMKYLWDDILSKHPTTKNIFLTDRGFDIQHRSTYKKLIDKLNALDISKTEYDVLGNAYEEVIQDIMTGKVLGQFFTQPAIKKMMVKLINPQMHPNGKIDTCGDPAMGTGGFLITYLQYVMQQAKEKNIKVDWNFIKAEGLYGKEIEPDTYQLAVSNMLISSGHMFEQLERGDSIRDPITRKFDNILANPPFGIKGLKYDDFKSSLKREYTPIKTDNAVSLFIQAIIYMLKINGKCAVVIPDGQDLFSKTNKTLITVREYLMKTCDLREIIYLPSGIFTYTSIKTCVFYFVKKREGTEVLETKLKVSKTQKVTGRIYKFLGPHQTNEVKFYEYDPYADVKKSLVDVPIEKIASNAYSLNYAEYIKDEIEEKYADGVVVKTLGEVCCVIKGEKKRSKDGKEKGLYPLYYCSILGNLYLDTFDYTGEGIIVNKTNGSGKAMVYYGNNKYNVGETTIHFKSKINELQTKYVYYYLFHNIELLQKYFKGANQKSIVDDDLFKIKIPIPPLDRQREIVEYLDFIYEKANKTSNEKITELKRINKFCLRHQKIFGENEIKTLKEVCEFQNGKRIVKEKVKTGEYPVYGGGRAMFYTNTFNREGYNILIGRFALSPECVRFVNEKIFLNDSGLSIKPKTDILLHKYIGYYLLHNQNIIYNCARGSAQKNLDIGEFKSIKIPIPPLDRQREIVEYLDYNDTLIKQLEREIEQNIKQANFVIKSAVKSIAKTDEQPEPDENKEIDPELDEPEQESDVQEPEEKINPPKDRFIQKSSRSRSIRIPEELDEKEAEEFKRLNDNTVEELNAICKQLKIVNYSKLNKTKLILRIIEKRKYEASEEDLL